MCEDCQGLRNTVARLTQRCRALEMMNVYVPDPKQAAEITRLTAERNAFANEAREAIDAEERDHDAIVTRLTAETAALRRALNAHHQLQLTWMFEGVGHSRIGTPFAISIPHCPVCGLTQPVGGPYAPSIPPQAHAQPDQTDPEGC